MRFRDYFSLKHILFAIVLIAVMLAFAVRQSNNTVKVNFGSTEVSIFSSKYSLSIPYNMVASAKLTELAVPGDRLADAYDDDILRAGFWENETWGEYYIVADLDVDTCIVTELDDGRIFVFSRKNDNATAGDFEILKTHIS